jgi:hypothetical protein
VQDLINIRIKMLLDSEGNGGGATPGGSQSPEQQPIHRFLLIQPNRFQCYPSKTVTKFKVNQKQQSQGILSPHNTTSYQISAQDPDQLNILSQLGQKLHQSFLITPQQSKLKKLVMIQSTDSRDKLLVQRAKKFNKQHTVGPIPTQTQTSKMNATSYHPTETATKWTGGAALTKADPFTRQATRQSVSSTGKKVLEYQNMSQTKSYKNQDTTVSDLDPNASGYSRKSKAFIKMLNENDLDDFNMEVKVS